MINILAVDDDKDIVKALKIYLSAEGYNVLEAYNGKEALEIFEKNDIKLVLMDVMMPVMDGIETLVEIRKKSTVPVILITAKSEAYDKILGLNIGADDYITKPFNPVEVVARAKSQLRRFTMFGNESAPHSDKLVNGGIVIDDKEKTVTVDGEPINLTPKEYLMLKFFVENVGEVFSLDKIYRAVWEEAPLGAEKAVSVFIRKIREKIEIDPANPRYIVSVWGHGYKMEKR